MQTWGQFVLLIKNSPRYFPHQFSPICIFTSPSIWGHILVKYLLLEKTKVLFDTQFWLNLPHYFLFHCLFFLHPYLSIVRHVQHFSFQSFMTPFLTIGTMVVQILMTKKNLLFKPVILIEFTYNCKYDTSTTNLTQASKFTSSTNKNSNKISSNLHLLFAKKHQ